MSALFDRFYGRGYTEAEWAAIAKTVRDGLGRDANQLMVSLPVPYVVFSDGNAPQSILLRTAIQRMVEAILAMDPYPPWVPKERLLELKDQVDRLLEASLEELYFFQLTDLDHFLPGLEKFSDKLQELAQEAPIRKVAARINRYDKHRNHLLVELWELWGRLGGAPTGKAVEAFLNACIEPALGKQERAGGIRSWIERYLKGGVRFYY